MNKPAKLRSRNPGTGDSQMMYSLVRAAHVLESRLEEALEQVGLSLAKFGALSHLVKEGESAPNFASERPTCSKASSDRKSTRLNSSHRCTSYAVFCLKKKKKYSRKV